MIMLTAVGAGFPRPMTSGAETAPLRNMTKDRDITAAPQRPTVGQVIAYFKYQSAKRINALLRTPGHVVWQRNYYDHIIRHDADLDRIRDYIVNNPLRWELDRLYPANPSKW